MYFCGASSPNLRALLVAAAAFCFLAFAGAVRAADLITEEIDYTRDGVSMGFLAYPQDASNAPAVILVHDWWGLNDQIRSTALRLAEEGYVALAVDLFGGVSTTDADEARTLASTVRANSQDAITNLAKAIAYLASFDERVDEERLSSIGWGFGGGWSYELAINNLGTRASVVYYGLVDPQDNLSQTRAAIIGHFASEDTTISLDTVEQFEARLEALNGSHEVYVYPHTGHGFADESASDYDADAAEEAWQRTLDFLHNQL